MPVLIAFLVNALRVMLFTRAGSFLVSLLSFFGLQIATQKLVIGPALEQVASFFTSGVPGGEIGAAALQWAGVLRLDQAASMLISAVGARMTIGAARAFLAKK